MPRSVFADQNGAYLTNLKTFVQKGLDELVPYKIIGKDEISKNGFYMASIATISQNVLANRRGNTNQIAKSRIKIKNVPVPLETFSTSQDISIRELMDGSTPDAVVKTNLEIGLIKDGIKTVIYGKSALKMQGFASLVGRSKFEPAKITSGKELYDAISSAIAIGEKNDAKLDEFWQVLLPGNYSKFLKETYNETQNISVRQALLNNLKAVVILQRGLSHPIAYQPDEEVLFVPLLPEIFFRRVSIEEADSLQAHIRTAGLVHLNPAEVVEIVPKVKVE